MLAIPGRTHRGIDFVTTKNININNFGNRNFIGFTGLAGGSYYAVRVPASQITAAATAAGGELLFHSVAVDSTATIDLEAPLDKATGFLGQDDDFAPFYLKFPRLIGGRVLSGIAAGTITDLFLVLRLPPGPPFPGLSNFPPLIGLDGGVAPNDAPIFGLSYVSTDGGVTFNQRPDFTFRFSLVLSER